FAKGYLWASDYIYAASLDAETLSVGGDY
ncbi:MAG: hypothetical protein ACI9Z9_000663, partial [Litorivivens sp.]